MNLDLSNYSGEIIDGTIINGTMVGEKYFVALLHTTSVLIRS